MSESRHIRPLSFLLVLVLGFFTLAGVVARDGWGNPRSQQSRFDDAQLTQVLMITDLALWTEARYTRHPSQADFFTPFQSTPAAMDHFVSGTWIQPAVRHKNMGLKKIRHQ